MSAARRKGDPLVFAFYLTFFFVLFWPVVFGGRSFARADIYPYYYPVWKFACEELRQGRIPLWDPYTGFGSPFAANPQSCLFYPLTALWLGIDFVRGLNLYILFHLALAAFSAYFFMREHEAPAPAALLSGFAFSLGGYAMSTVRLTISLCSVAYFPLALALCSRAGKESSFRWKAAAAAVLLLQYLAGDPSVSGVTLAVCLAASIANGRRGMGSFFGVLLLFAALGAFQILPFAEFVSLSTRTGVGYAAAAKWSFPPSCLWEFVVPQALAASPRAAEALPWLENVYAGLSVFLLALFCIRRGAPALEKKLFALGLVGLLLAFGRFGSVHYLLFKTVPLFRLVRFPERFLFLVHFALACLAGLGAARLSGGNRMKAAAALVIVAADLVLMNAALPTVPVKAFRAPSENVRTVTRDKDLFRVMASPQMLYKAYKPHEKISLEEELAARRDQFFPNLPLADRIHSLWNYESVYLKRSNDLLWSFPGAEPAEAKKFWNRWNIRYFTSPKDQIAGLERMGGVSGAGLFRNPDVWPRIYFAQGPRVEEAEDGLHVTGEEVPSPAEVLLYEPDRVRVRVRAPEKGWLIFTDAYYPGWEAKVDGKDAPVRLAEHAFRAVPLEAGTHAVEWTFRPGTLKLGSLISLAALAFLFLKMRSNIKVN